ncbi:hypothetical protein PVBG_06184 [Plasmodium vivax Brazil I]|uniref:Variable surface protein Vir35 n=1 Tax=Plasmodium vivax (strain Brazil I) TaxID=1033975 RepID=A0A0J9T079_PLAV1|nr:hypothetical protein PVBG_06184 [Plasmodium vivax Brazil I]
MLMNYNLRENMGFYFLFKIITLVFLIWIHHPYDYRCYFHQSSGKKSEHDSIIDIDFNRLLAQYEFKKQLDHLSLSKNSPGYSKLKEIKNDKYISTYSHVKKGKANDLDAYKREYKKRYDKKKGLEKLDCYCEKKIFDKIEYLEDLSYKMKNKKYYFITKILIRYVLIFILFSLIPFLGFIYPSLGGTGENKECLVAGIRKTTYQILGNLNIVLSYIALAIVILTIIYTFIKVVKYEKVKAGKVKMSIKEYCQFCKEIF